MTGAATVSDLVFDRLILTGLGRKLSAEALLLVEPATMLGWHRAVVDRCCAALGGHYGAGLVGAYLAVEPDGTALDRLSTLLSLRA